MRIDIVTLFPDLFDALKFGILAKAIESKRITVNLWNPRDFTHNAHGYVDDKPYGGGPGMVLCYEPLSRTVAAIKKDHAHTLNKTICLTPTGKSFNHTLAVKNSTLEQLTLICGRYEGIDQRFIDNCIDECWSIGDFVLSGGEFAACCIIDAISRHIPGVLGNPNSLTTESFSEENKYDYPVYTRPYSIDGHNVPKVLLDGNHKEIAEWREKHRTHKED